MWQGLGLLFGLSFLVLIAASLITPPESAETLKRFYERCRPPGFWGAVRKKANVDSAEIPGIGTLLLNSALGIAACLGLVLATNALFVTDWLTSAIGLAAAVLLGGYLIRRVWTSPAMPSKPALDNKKQ